MEDDGLEDSECDFPCSPKKDKLKYIDDDDLISSDESSSNKPKKYNQLKPKAHFFYKLLHSAKPKSEDIWKNALVPEAISLVDIDTFNLDLYSASHQKMAKISKKRKREEDSLGKEKLDKRKIAKSSHARLNHSLVHNMSPSESDCSVKGPSKRTSKKLNKKNDSSGGISQSECNSDSDQERTLHSNKSGKDSNKYVNQNEVVTNGHSDSEDSSFDIGGNSDCDFEQSKSRNTNKPSGSNSFGGLNSNPSDTDSIKEKFYQHNFTEKDRENMSKYSFLLSDELCEKNNIWILQCPSNMDCSGLESQYLDLRNSCQLNIGSHSFETYNYNDSIRRSVTLAVPSSDNNLKLCMLRF